MLRGLRLASGVSARDAGYSPIIALDACGTFIRHKREAGIARLVSLGIEISDYPTLMVEIMGDNAVPEARQVYGALDMPFATLMRQVVASLTARSTSTTRGLLLQSLTAGYGPSQTTHCAPGMSVIGRYRTGCFGRSKYRSGHSRLYGVVATIGPEADVRFRGHFGAS